ncbi:hypothetical protein K2173_018833 [Erythroxylum novogranatense]|uniref:Uncharacterized protein n=1 Tax=Erythroxylum novogranatense TaxID=1862640 RepID=A0AAV8SAV7_9ROSI|nr:hypothetical protein K2173_018833 [Erythroxylum novogranatense]
MKQRIRRSPEPFLRFLKPGALAQLRDSRISARSYRLPQISPAPSPSPSPPSIPQSQLISMDAAFPCFSPLIYGPRCPRRKKLLPAKAALLSPSPPSDPIINVGQFCY